jgi:hypothetical protein
MRVDHDLLQCAVFLSTGEPEHLTHHATAFLMVHKGATYLVTAKHVAEELGDSAFYVRFNRSDGVAGLLPIDFAMEAEELFRWFAHPKSTVDVAILPFPVDLTSQGVVAVALNSEMTVRLERPMSDAGCGDMCHVIGLFAARAGKVRNAAVVHTGHIAAMCDSKELVELLHKHRSIELEGYLVEISNLSGLSGAPVFVREGVELDVPISDTDKVVVTTNKPDLRLLGVWCGSWDMPASDLDKRVPVGIGIVAPAHRLLELLESSDVAENRSQWIAKLSAARAD